MAGCGTSVVPPILLESGRLAYPPNPKAARIEGSVVVVYNISVGGEVSDIRIVSAEPEGVFEDAAVAFVQTWRFQPQKRSGVAEAVTDIQSRISFTLADGEASYLEFIE